MNLIDLYCFRGWTRKEKRDFWLSLVLTIMSCAIVYLFAAIMQ